MPSRLVLVLVGFVFLVTLLVRLPARVLSALLPSNLDCVAPEGTVWRGSCAQVRSGEISLSDVRWTLQPLSLLRAQPAIDVDSADPRAAGHAEVTLHRSGQIDLAGVSAALGLQSGLLPVPDGWNGRLQIDLRQAVLSGGHVASIVGNVRLLQLALERPAMDFGSFELAFPAAGPGAPIAGSLRDLGGPLALQGTLHLSGKNYELDARVASRNTSDPHTEQMLQLLGPADADGQHALSLAGTY